jgi:NTE family protein
VRRAGTAGLSPLIAALLLVAAPGRSDSTPPLPKPRLALVLSGGGARGAAHIGVLKVLEELHVPVDFIAGTSMGSVVGGLYASGLTPAEMETLVATTDWDDLFDDSVSRSDLSYRRKRDQDGTLVRPVIGMEKGRPSIPSGLVSGQKLNFLLRRLTLPVATVTDFDLLRIRFRTVATDIETGNKHVFAGGILPEAIRASMAFPGLFSPVDVDGKRLVDGGVAENFPVDEALASGAERIIGVDIGSRLARRKELATFLQIVSQTTGFVTSRNVADSRGRLRPGDLLILPDIPGVSFADFKEMPRAVAAGEKAARERAEELRKYAVSDAEWTAWLRKVRPPKGPLPVVTRVELVNESPLPSTMLMEIVKTRPGPLQLDQLRRDLDLLYATGEMEIVDWRLVPDEGGASLQILAKDKAWGQTKLRFGLDQGTDFQGTSGFSFLLKVQRTAVNPLGGEWRVAAGSGEQTVVEGEWYQPLVTSGAFFIAPSAFYRTTPDPWRDDSLVFDDTRWALQGELDLGVAPSRSWEIRAGLFRGLETSFNKVPGTDTLRYNTGGAVVRVGHDRLDNYVIPTRGTFGKAELLVSLPELGSEFRYRRLSGTARAVETFGRSTFELTAAGSTALGAGSQKTKPTPPSEYFSLGGLFQLSGWTPGLLVGDYLAFGSLVYRYRLGSLPKILGGGLYGGISLEAGNAWSDPADVDLSSLHPAGSVFVAGDTIIGPVHLAFGLSREGRHALYLQIGKVF